MSDPKFKYCPSCGCEFREEFNLCSDCKIELVSEKPRKPEETDEKEDIFASEGWVKLLDNVSDFEADMAISMLKYYGIDAKKFYKGESQYISLFMGALNSSVYVIVKKLQYQDAKEIINSEADFQKIQDTK